MSDNLLELFKISYEKKYQLNVNLIDEKYNKIDFDRENKKIDIIIGDPESKNLPSFIEETINKLK